LLEVWNKLEEDGQEVFACPVCQHRIPPEQVAPRFRGVNMEITLADGTVFCGTADKSFEDCCFPEMGLVVFDQGAVPVGAVIKIEFK